MAMNVIIFPSKRVGPIAPARASIQCRVAIASSRAAQAASWLRCLPGILTQAIYAEASIRFSRIEDLDAALPKAMFDREPIPYEAAFFAGKAFFAYRRRGGRR
jgi:hypothetical protein